LWRITPFAAKAAAPIAGLLESKAEGRMRKVEQNIFYFFTTVADVGFDTLRE